MYVECYIKSMNKIGNLYVRTLGAFSIKLFYIFLIDNYIINIFIIISELFAILFAHYLINNTDFEMIYEE
jgi:hypothetical protein